MYAVVLLFLSIAVAFVQTMTWSRGLRDINRIECRFSEGQWWCRWPPPAIEGVFVLVEDQFMFQFTSFSNFYERKTKHFLFSWNVSFIRFVCTTLFRLMLAYVWTYFSWLWCNWYANIASLRVGDIKVDWRGCFERLIQTSLSTAHIRSEIFDVWF